MVILYIALVFVIIGYLGTVLIAWQSISERDHVTYIALIFVLLGAAGAIWVTIDSSRTTDQLVIKSGKISELALELKKKADDQAESQQLLRKRSDEIASLNREVANNQRKLREKSDEIANLYKTIAPSITGGDYYGELTVYPPNGENEVYFTFRNAGKYPLYDVRVNIEDEEKVSEVLGPLFYSIEKRRSTSNPVSIPEWHRTRQQASTTITLGDTGLNHAIDFGPIVIPNTDDRDYRITILARNGFMVKLVKFKKIEGKWKMVIRDLIDGKTFKEYGDTDFPKNKEGKIDW